MQVCNSYWWFLEVGLHRWCLALSFVCLGGSFTHSSLQLGFGKIMSWNMILKINIFWQSFCKSYLKSFSVNVFLWNIFKMFYKKSKKSIYNKANFSLYIFVLLLSSSGIRAVMMNSVKVSEVQKIFKSNMILSIYVLLYISSCENMWNKVSL